MGIAKHAFRAQLLKMFSQLNKLICQRFGFTSMCFANFQKQNKVFFIHVSGKVSMILFNNE